MIITGNASEPIEVWDLSGTKKTVKYGHLMDQDGTLKYIADSSVKWYLTTNVSVPKEDFRACTIADYTIIVNRKIIPVMDTTELIERKPNEVIVWLKQSQPNTKIRITMNGITLERAVPAGGATDVTVGKLYDQLIEQIPGIKVDKLGSVMRIRMMNGGDFTWAMSDGYGERTHLSSKGTVQKFTDLPPKCWAGTRLRVEQDENSKFDHYYVEFESSDRSGYGDGVWKECRGWDMNNRFNAWSMPYRLVRMSDGTFVFAPCAWEERLVGDEDLAPTPSFIGTEIENVFMYRNRLGFLAGDNVILSAASDFFRYWPRTVVELLDDDPIDIAATGSEVATLRHAVGFEKQLMLMADKVQFALSTSNTILTPDTVAVDATTHFPCSPTVEPVASGANLYFLSPAEIHTRVREYLVQPDTMMTDAADVTAHVPHYLPAGSGEMVALPTYDMLLVHFASTPKEIYIYTYHWNGDEKVQSAWSKRVFDSDILTMKAFDSWVYLLVGESGQIHLERFCLEKTSSGILPWQVHLDRLVTLTGTYYPGLATTYWTLPYDDTSAEYEMIHSVTGAKLPAIKYDFNHMSAPGDLSGAPVYVGRKYTAWYRMSEWYVRDQNDKPVIDAVLKFKFLTLHYKETGYLSVQVTAPGRDPISDAVGPDSPMTGTKRFPVMADARGVLVDIINDSCLPSEVHAGERSGVLTKK